MSMRRDRGGTLAAVLMNFNHLYYFHVVASEGSVKGAADRLGVTQPTVSEQIRSLERSLGMKLFERIAGGLRLTQAGREAFEHTTQMFLASERLVEALGKAGAPPSIALRVGVSSAISRTMTADFLMPVLMVERCRPSIRTGEFAELIRELRGHDLDLVIGETEPLKDATPSLETALIARPSLVAIVSAESEPSEDWSNLALIEYRPTSAFHWEVDAFLEERELHPKCAGETDDAFLMLAAVERGGFLAFVTGKLARAATKTGRVRALASFETRNVGVHAVYQPSDTLALARAAVHRLIESAREHVDE
jgi:LysR family transcriptional activator of nhaA